jgi:hypothetical protein
MKIKKVLSLEKNQMEKYLDVDCAYNSETIRWVLNNCNGQQLRVHRDFTQASITLFFDRLPYSRYIMQRKNDLVLLVFINNCCLCL